MKHMILLTTVYVATSENYKFAKNKQLSIFKKAIVYLIVVVLFDTLIDSYRYPNILILSA